MSCWHRLVARPINWGWTRIIGLVAKDDDALQTLLTAERKSPGIVRHSAVVREVVRSMYRRAPATAGKKSSPLLALAERCRAMG
jgi:hypothetical protein